MNYAELAAAIQVFAVDDEPAFLAMIPTFVGDTEKRIFSEADLPAAQLDITVATVVGDPLLTMPGGFLSVDSLSMTVAGATVYLTPKSTDFLRTAYPVAANGVPRYFAVYDATQLQVVPAPDAVYPVYVEYFGYPPSIVTAGTSWLGDNFSRALLYGALRDAAVFLKEEADIVTMYNNQYTEALSQVKAFGVARAGTDRYRTRG
jgi:hypothetical protein